MKYNLSFTDDIFNINDSMEVESGTELARLECGDKVVTLEVRGDVRVRYKEQIYKTPCQFPEDLIKAFHNNTAFENSDIIVIDNNWFEVFVWNVNGKELIWTGWSEAIDLGVDNAASLFGLLHECLVDYIQFLDCDSDETTSAAKAAPMTEDAFDAKWSGHNPDEMDEDELRAFKNDCFALYEAQGFLELFDSPYDDIGGGMHDHNGMRFEVIRRATEEECDLESMPLWFIRFENGDEAYCYPEEITKLEIARRKKSRKFEVHLSYHGCYSTEIVAESEEQALEKARSQAASLDSTEFLSAIECVEDNTDISEIE